MSQDDSPESRPVVLSPNQLSAAALRGLIEEFVTRDGTDYGAVERILEHKITALAAQVRSGEAVIVFDPATETANIVLKDEVAGVESPEGRG